MRDWNEFWLKYKAFKIDKEWLEENHPKVLEEWKEYRQPFILEREKQKEIDYQRQLEYARKAFDEQSQLVLDFLDSDHELSEEIVKVLKWNIDFGRANPSKSGQCWNAIKMLGRGHRNWPIRRGSEEE